MKSAPHCLTISAGMPFLKTLAAWVMEHHGREPEALPQVRILLPNRRACHALGDAFLDLAGGRPMLLPRLAPIGDLEESDLPLALLAETSLDIPPPVDKDRRLMLLARLVLAFGKKQDSQPAQAVQLARQLARFLDDIGRENLDIKALAALTPDDGDMARHWQETLDFLSILSDRWPQVLKEEGALDLMEHRNRVIAAVADAWRRKPPPGAVIAAGSTGTQPATAALLKVIARLPQGAVIVPGLDRKMPEAEWRMVGATHPQYALKQLLERMDVVRKDVTPLAGAHHTERTQCLAAALAPPEATAAWARAEIPLKGMEGVRCLTADTPLDEARLIAVALRETLETPGKTAALVTPDRALARMVAAQMQRFGVVLDDSAGQPLLATPAGCFLRLAIAVIEAKAAPADLLALLRHPLAAAGMDPAECRRLSRLLEKPWLRGVRPSSGWRALCESAAGKQPALSSLLAALEKETRTLAAWFSSGKKIALPELLKEHLRLAEWLAGADRLWAGDDGNQLAQALARWVETSAVLPPMDPRAYPGCFDALLAEDIYRPRYGLHPRLAILSPIEARLQHYDRMILGSLNEKTWPALPVADPWMSRPMRQAFGLPPPERTIGQSAHDFSLLAQAPEVFLTRSRKADGAPASPSRWLVRLETLLEGKDAGAWARLSGDVLYASAKDRLDAPSAMTAIARPSPSPPVEARPRQASVTDMELWRRDPYAFYAKRVLGLKALAPLDQEPDAAEFGMLVHDAFRAFVERWPRQLPEHATDALLEIGRAAFAKYRDRPAVGCLWWPRFEAMAQWLIAREQERRAPGLSVSAEQDIAWDVTPLFTLKGRIDRVEMDGGKAATVIDYKTGATPKDKDIKSGVAGQLPLEGLMLLASGHAAAVTGLEYWKLSANAKDAEIKTLENVEALLEQCKTQLETLIREYGDPATPYAAQADPSLLPGYNDYEHLTRRKEWQDV